MAMFIGKIEKKKQKVTNTKSENREKAGRLS